MKSSRFHLQILMLIGCSAAASAQDSSRPVTSGVIEHYFYAKPKQQGLGNRLSWMQADTRWGKWTISNQFIYMNDILTLDENYIRFEEKNYSVRAGRMRSQFGFWSWSDIWYTPFINAAIARWLPLTNVGSLMNFDTGIEGNLTFKDWQFNFAAVDNKNHRLEVVPSRIDTIVSRVQYRLGPLMLGANLKSKVVGPDTEKSALYGIDWRYTIPNWQLRGEFITGNANPKRPHALYADLMYRPAGLAYTQFGLRYQEVAFSKGGAPAQLYTFAVKQKLCPYTVLQLNYSTGNRLQPSAGARGWSLQTMISYKF